MALVASLTSADIDFGKRVTEQLKTAKFPLSGTFWLYDEDSDDWRFVIATELVDKEGSRSAYLSLLKGIAGSEGSDFQRLRITLISPQSPMYKALRAVFAGAENVEGARLQNTSLGSGIIIPNAYLYEIR